MRKHKRSERCNILHIDTRNNDHHAGPHSGSADVNFCTVVNYYSAAKHTDGNSGPNPGTNHHSGADHHYASFRSPLR